MNLEEHVIRWFDFGAKDELRADAKGVFRSKVFPGLWIDGPALLAGNSTKAIKVLQRGLADKSHTAFCRALAKQHSKK